MSNLTLCTLNPDVFRVCADKDQDRSYDRAKIVAAGRSLFYDFTARGQSAVRTAMKSTSAEAKPRMTSDEYVEMNRKFLNARRMYAAKKACEVTGRTAPENYEQFRAMQQSFISDPIFHRVLQGIDQDVINPILPRVFSEAVGVFADMENVGFGETKQITVDSADIPVFQDSAWGASRSVPANRFYTRDYTLNPQPKTCEIRAKWAQVVGNDTDFGRYYANIAAGMYAYVMGMWSQMMAAAATDTTLIPTGLTYTFNQTNWVTLANKISAVNNTFWGNLYAFGNAVALSKVLPTDVTGSTNVNMDAAIATMLGANFTAQGYLGEYMGVMLMPLVDAIRPGTQFTTVETILDPTKIWMLSGNGRKPLTIGFNQDTPISLEWTPSEVASLEIVYNLTIALDSVAVFSSKVGLINI